MNDNMDMVITIVRCEGVYVAYYAHTDLYTLGDTKHVCGESREEVVGKLMKSIQGAYSKIYCIDNTEREILTSYSEGEIAPDNVCCITEHNTSKEMMKRIRSSKSNTVSRTTAGLDKTFLYFFNLIGYQLLEA